MEHPERWFRVWFTTSGTYSEVSWVELQKVREAYRLWNIQKQDTLLDVTTISGGTLIVVASRIECIYVLDQDSWREGCAQAAWQTREQKKLEEDWS